MTSTSFNVGLNEPKNSSKVIKPPGGGHSDIFGIHSNLNQIVTPSKRRYQPVSSINSCFKEIKPTNKTDKEDVDSDMNKNGSTEESVNETNENIEPKKTETKIEEEQQQQQDPPRRVRVPPGGFSTALCVFDSTALTA